jgi:hypothetical protein
LTHDWRSDGKAEGGRGLARHGSGRAPAFVELGAFVDKVLEPFRNYALPVISLKKETSKEAVCLVFEKVNTGGVPLSVFELITATWAADGFNLRDDWFGGRGKSGRHARLSKKPLLRDLQPTDFLQGVSLLHSLEKRTQDLAAGRSGKEASGVTAKREHVLEMPLAAFGKWAERLTKGYEQAERFLRSEVPTLPGHPEPTRLGAKRTLRRCLGAARRHVSDGGHRRSQRRPHPMSVLRPRTRQDERYTHCSSSASRRSRSAS